MKLKATKGNIAKHTIITNAYPNQDTITAKELRQVSQDNAATLLASDGKTSLAYYITYNVGTDDRGVYHLPKLENGFFVADEDDIVTTPTGKKLKHTPKVEDSVKKVTLGVCLSFFPVGVVTMSSSSATKNPFSNLGKW
jgi:hypothetical protein